MADGVFTFAFLDGVLPPVDDLAFGGVLSLGLVFTAVGDFFKALDPGVLTAALDEGISALTGVNTLAVVVVLTLSTTAEKGVSATISIRETFEAGVSATGGGLYFFGDSRFLAGLLVDTGAFIGVTCLAAGDLALDAFGLFTTFTGGEVALGEGDSFLFAADAFVLICALLAGVLTGVLIRTSSSTRIISSVGKRSLSGVSFCLFPRFVDLTTLLGVKDFTEGVLTGVWTDFLDGDFFSAAFT